MDERGKIGISGFDDRWRSGRELGRHGNAPRRTGYGVWERWVERDRAILTSTAALHRMGWHLWSTLRFDPAEPVGLALLDTRATLSRAGKRADRRGMCYVVSNVIFARPRPTRHTG